MWWFEARSYTVAGNPNRRLKIKPKTSTNSQVWPDEKWQRTNFFLLTIGVTGHKCDWRGKIKVKEIWWDFGRIKYEVFNLFGNQGMITIFLLRREILCTGMQGAVPTWTRVLNDLHADAGDYSDPVTQACATSRGGGERRGYWATTYRRQNNGICLLTWKYYIFGTAPKHPS